MVRMSDIQHIDFKAILRIRYPLDNNNDDGCAKQIMKTFFNLYFSRLNIYCTSNFCFSLARKKNSVGRMHFFNLKQIYDFTPFDLLCCVVLSLFLFFIFGRGFFGYVKLVHKFSFYDFQEYFFFFFVNEFDIHKFVIYYAKAI